MLRGRRPQQVPYLMMKVIETILAEHVTSTEQREVKRILGALLSLDSNHCPLDAKLSLLKEKNGSEDPEPSRRMRT